MAAETFPAGLRVLAVEHDRVCCKVLERQLTYCNYNPTMVTNAQAALEMLRERKDEENQFDLVISNVANGFKLLEVIGLEMDLPVIMLSANSETQTIVKGIKHGACDYMVKPVRLEQLRGIWTHVVKNSKTDPQNSIRSEDGDEVENIGANHTKKYSRKNKKAVDVADENSENTSTQKKRRVRWSGELHQKFVQAIHQIGIDRAVPKKILEVMNVEGLTKENVASHLQKYRIYLRKLNEGTVRNSNFPLGNETEALRRNMSVQSFIGSPSSSNHFANMSSSSAIGMQASLPTESVQVMSCHRNLGIPQSNMEPVGHSVSLPKDVVPMPVQDISRFISSGKSYAPVSSRWLPVASQCFPSGPSRSSFANSSNGDWHNVGHNVGTSEDPLQGNIFNINQLSRFAGSSRQIPTFGNEYQMKIPGIMEDTIPMVGFGEKVSAFSFGNNTHPTATPIGNSALASSSSTRPDLQIDNSAMPTQVLNGVGASDNLHVGSSSTVNQQVVSDQVNNNINEFLMGTSGAQNGESSDVDDFLANLDSFIDGDWQFGP